MPSCLALVLGLLLLLGTLLDGFETILLPRRISRRFRYSRLYYRAAWTAWRAAASALPPGRWRETVLSVFGPLSMLGLFSSWILSLIVGFGLIQWAVAPPPVGGGYPTALYFSGTTFFTLGLGDVAPTSRASRALTVGEAGLGFGFLAIIIGYLPVLYQAFSRREVTISLMDARAGSPPTGGEALARLARLSADDGIPVDVIDPLLREWEQWSAELLESHISFPVLAYYRSQHANQSWLAALTTMLDATALLLTALPADRSHQAQLTFAMARHAAVDITLVFGVQPQPPTADRLGATGAAAAERLRHVGLSTDPAEQADRFTHVRGMYEPFLGALAAHFLLSLPPVFPADPAADNWQRSAWMPRTPGIGRLPATTAAPPAGATSRGDHFD